MSGNHAASESWAARFRHALNAMPARRGRWAVLACILIICCSLSAAAGLQMLLEMTRAEARNFAWYQTRAEENLSVAEARLSHYQAIGLRFANGGLAGEAVIALPGMKGIAVASDDGPLLRHSGIPLDMSALAAMLRAPRMVIGDGRQLTIVFRAGDRIIAVAFAQNLLLPPELARGTALIRQSGSRISGPRLQQPYAEAEGRVWPVRLRTAVPPLGSRGLWGVVPVLFIYLILVPLAAGGWLFWIFRRELTWRAQASLIIRTLRQAWQQPAGNEPEKRRPT